MPRTRKSGLLSSNLYYFCATTGLHGFSYLSQDRSRAERAFWVFCLLVCFVWLVVLISDAFKSWIESPVITNVAAFKYDAAKVDFPAISLCPRQQFSDLHLAEHHFNRLKFNCRDDGYMATEDSLPVCSDPEIQVLRSPQSSFHGFISRLDAFIDEIVENTVPNSGGPMKEMLIDLSYEYIDLRLFPARKEMPLDEAEFSYAYSSLLGNAFNEELPSIHAGYLGVQTISFRDIWTEFGLYKNAPHIPEKKHIGADREMIDIFKATNNRIPQLGISRVISDELSIFLPHAPIIYENGLPEEEYQVLLSMLKKSYFVEKLNAVPFGTLIRQHIRKIGGDSTILEKVLSVFSNSSTFQSIYFMNEAQSYMNHTEDDNAYFVYTDEAIRDVLIALQHGMIRGIRPVKTNDDPIRGSSLPNQLDLNGPFALETIPRALASVEEDFQDQHYLHKLITDSDKNFVNMVLIFEKSIRAAIFNGFFVTSSIERDSNSVSNENGQLNMVRYCSADSLCSTAAMTPTSAGLCTTFNGVHPGSLGIEGPYYSLLEEFFPHVEENAAGRLSDLKEPLILMIDLFHSEIHPSQDDTGYFLFKVGAKETYINQLMSTKLYPGTDVKVKIKAQVQDMDEHIKDFDKDTRKCLLKGENIYPESMFNAYHEETCFFECIFRSVQRNFSCVPWDVPFTFVQGQTRICSGAEGLQFKEAMTFAQIQCACPPACEATHYGRSIDTFRINSRAVCLDDTYYKHIHDTFEMAAFAIYQSAKVNYLLNEQSNYIYCEEKLQRDIVLLHIEVETFMLERSNLERTATELDQIGLIGGNLGLFLGFSLVVLLEVLEVLAFSSIQSRLINPGANSKLKNSILAQSYTVCEGISFHGMAHIVSSKWIWHKTLWSILTVGMILTGWTFTALSIISFLEYPTITTLLYDSASVTDYAFPTVTLCPVQFYDRHNFLRLLLNQESMKDPATGQLSEKIYNKYQYFFEELAAHSWISGNEMKHVSPEEKEIFFKLLPAIAFNRDRANYLRQMAYTLINGDLSFLESRNFTLGENSYYEINMIRPFTAYMMQLILAERHVDRSNVELLASPSPITDLADLRHVQRCEQAYLLRLGPVFDDRIDEYVAIECSHSLTGTYFYAVISADIEVFHVGPLSGSKACSEDSFYYDNHCYGKLNQDEKCDLGTLQHVMKSEFAAICNSGVGYYKNCSTILPLEQEACLEFNKLENVLVYHPNELDTFDLIAICHQLFKGCIEGILLTLQTARLLTANLNEFGSLSGLFLETAVSGSFHPVLEFGPNRYILEQFQPETAFYNELTALLDDIMLEPLGDSLHIPLNEFTSLFESTSTIWRKQSLSRREKSFRQEIAAPLHYWEQDTFQNASYTFVYPEHRAVQFSLMHDLRWGEYGGPLRKFLNAALVNYREGTEKTISYDLNVGEDFLKEMGAQNIFGVALRGKLKEIMTVMRFSQVIGNSSLHQAEWAELFQLRAKSREELTRSALQTYIYVQRSNGMWTLATEAARHNYELHEQMLQEPSTRNLEMLHSCQINEDTCDDIVHHLVTDRGICSAVNSVSSNELYRDLSYFQLAFDPVYSQSTRQSGIQPLAAGLSNGLQLVLDIHTTDVIGTENGHFDLSLNSFLDAFHTQQAFSIYPGQQATVWVKMLLKVSMDSVRDIPQQQRSCRFSYETDEKAIFRRYTQKGCYFQCQLDRALKNTTCIPWDIYHTEETLNAPVCTGEHVSDFYRLLLTPTKSCSQGCIEACESLLYHTSIDTVMVNAERRCLDDVSLQFAALQGVNTHVEKFFWNYIKTSYWHYDAFKCVAKVESDLAFLNVVIASEHAQVATMSKQYEPVDELALVGGTLALWTGFSFTSLMEIFYFTYVFIRMLRAKRN